MPRLVIKTGKGVGRDHALGAGEVVVGRDSGADFVLDDHLVSRRHFKVELSLGMYFAEDLGSTNGTLVNGRKVQRARLSDGDTIAAGGTRLTFVQKDILASGSSGSAALPAKPAAGSPAPKPAPAPTRRKKHLR